MWGRFERAKLGVPPVRSLISALALLIFFYIYYLRHLSTLTIGLGPREAQSLAASNSVSRILNNGFNAPYYLTQYLYRHIFQNQIFALRLASVSFAIIFILSLFILLKRWFGRSVAIFATLIFAATPWVVLLGRSAGPGIMYLWTLVLAFCYYNWARSSFKQGLYWFLLCILAALSLYTPGMIWLVIAGAVAAYRQLPEDAIEKAKSGLVVGGVLVLVILAPLIRLFVLNVHQLQTWFLIPDQWDGFLLYAKSVAWCALALVWHTKDHVDIGVGRLAVLNVLQIVLCVFGFYALAMRTRRTTVMLLAMLLIAIFLAGINQNLYVVTLGLPTLAVLSAAGLRYLFIEWRRIFPLNPIAYALAITMITLIVVMHLIFAWRYTLVAWPHSKETKAAYVLK